MSIKDKMNNLKKELLLEEASKQFEEIGYEHMKVVDLAKTARVSVGTIYSLFNSKGGLYLAYIEHQINNFFLELENRALSKSSPQEKIHTFIELKFSYYNQKRKAIEQSATNNPLFFNTLYKEHSQPFQKIYTYLAKCFIELNPSFDEAQAMRMAFGINGFSDGYISQWLELNDNLMSKVDEVSELFIRMIEGD
ncbi:MAG: TetR/AcrR family transcriptional regulator [Sulfurimonas sp.]|jgi:AcrR family transcriptional regulator|nr:TetR/AcrR family transcriptional regulator [Sulfurimonas sp.]